MHPCMPRGSNASFDGRCRSRSLSSRSQLMEAQLITKAAVFIGVSVFLFSPLAVAQDQLLPGAAAAARLRNLSPTVRADILKHLKGLRQPQRMLAIGPLFKNPSTTGWPADWAAAACNHSRWLQGADYEWTSVLNPKEGLEDRVAGLSGIVINERTSE